MHQGVPTCIVMSDEMREKLRLAAQANDLTVAALVRHAIRRYLNHLDVHSLTGIRAQG